MIQKKGRWIYYFHVVFCGDKRDLTPSLRNMMRKRKGLSILRKMRSRGRQRLPTSDWPRLDDIPTTPHPHMGNSWEEEEEGEVWRWDGSGAPYVYKVIYQNVIFRNNIYKNRRNNVNKMSILNLRQYNNNQQKADGWKLLDLIV